MKHSLTWVALMLGASAAMANPAAGLGTKPGGSFQPVQTPQLGIMPIVQLMVALGIVAVLLKWVLPKVAERLNKSFRLKSGQIVTIEETTPFQGGTLLVVKARGKQLLLGATGTSISTLADLTELPPETPSPFEVQLQSEVEIAPTERAYSTLDPAEALRRLTQLEPALTTAKSSKGELI